MGGWCSTDSTVDRSKGRTTEEPLASPAIGEDTSSTEKMGTAVDMLSKFIWGNPKAAAIRFFQKRKVNEMWVKAFTLLCVESGGMTDTQREYITKRAAELYPDVKCADVVSKAEEEKDAQDALQSIIKDLKRLYKNPSITIFPEYEQFRHSIPEYLLYLYVCATSPGPFSEMDMNIVYNGAEKLFVERDTIDYFVEMLRKEQSVLEFASGLLNSSDDSSEQKSEAMVLQEPYRGNVLFSVAGYFSVAESQAGNVMGALSDPDAYFQSFMSLVSIAAKGDRDLNLREEKALRMLAARMSQVRDVDAVVTVNPSEFEKHMEVIKNSLDELQSKVDMSQFGPMAASYPDNVMIHIMAASVIVATQDGLVQDGVNVVERIARRLGLSDGVVGKFMAIMRMEEELCRDFFEVFMSRHGAFSPSPPSSPR